QHTNPNTTPPHSPPCHSTHIRLAQNSPLDSCREDLHCQNSCCSNYKGPNHNCNSRGWRSSWPGFPKSCCPTETADRSIRHAPPSPTPLPSAADTHWPPSSHKPYPYPRWYKPA